MARRLALILLVAALTWGEVARADWVAPVEGGVAREFDFDRSAAFAGGAHRGVDLAARRGEVVRAPCSGRVTHAGPVPGHARGVTVRCGALVATVLDLKRTGVVRGAGVRRGNAIGAAAGATVHLGARLATDRHGYRDPLALLAPTAPLPPAGPRGRMPREVPPPPAPAPPATPAPRRVPSPADPPGRLPLVAWAGLALLAAGLPAGALWRRARARSAGRDLLAPRVAREAQ